MKSSPIDSSRTEEFLGLAVRLHGDDPAWVQPLDLVEAYELAGGGAFGAYSELQMFLCERDGAVVGRLAAIHNPRLPFGQIGYFESENDPAILASMLELALPWLAERGVSEVWGPMEGGAHRPHRFMTAGFDTDPFLFEPRNPPHYPAIFEANGFEAFQRWHSYELAPAMISALTQRLSKAVARAASRYTIVTFDMANPDLSRLHKILDRVWTGHPGYAPLDFEEFKETYAAAVSITTSPYLGVLENAAGEDMAIGFCYPDYIDELRALKGDAAGWGSWLGESRPTRLIMHTVAVVPEERGVGPSLVIVDHAAQHLPGDGFTEVVVALVVDTFKLFRRFAEPTREYALYKRSLPTKAGRRRA